MGVKESVKPSILLTLSAIDPNGLTQFSHNGLSTWVMTIKKERDDKH